MRVKEGEKRTWLLEKYSYWKFIRKEKGENIKLYFEK